MSLIETRHHQMFPVFDRAQIETAKRFASGPARNFAPGEVVFEAGERNARLGSCSRARLTWYVVMVSIVSRRSLAMAPVNSRAR